ncbi:DUF308 domain-containing protein [Methanospirillum purgamenti]|jgi:uncharacterized membrane protein HdeD (DUF308 family)|uniref:DUF308 domain-containing protein n=1 Tax=Methanospirillum hungatei TaxID=2203 RepID=A0A8F5VM53_METHU|nr:DUF308 domain-containing protein [Methanospirillum hungatei]QXO94566.1 DUF308 domain-containing protein [Methanospirillum hungatei]
MDDEVPTNEEIDAVVRSMPWWLVLVWGLLAIIIGLMFITTPLITTYYLVLFMGVYWFVGGIFTLVSLFSDKSNIGWKIFLSVISMLAGIAIMAQPLFGSIIVLTMLVFFIGFWGILIGGTKLYEAYRSKDAGAGILGVLSIIFGIILLVFPWGAALALPLIAGAFALLAGICSVVVAFQVKKAQA